MNEQLKDKSDNVKIMLDNIQPRLIEVSAGDHSSAGVLAVPNGMKLESTKRFMDELRTTPERRKGTESADRLQSFIDITNRFKNVDSVVFAKGEIADNSLNASLLTIFDYHPQGGDNTHAANAQHRVYYNFPVSKEFKFWLEGNCSPMGQEEFALLLEERIAEMVVANPDDFPEIANLKPKFADPLEILELSRNLQIYSNESVQQAGKLSSGEREIKFTAEHTAVGKDGKPVTIPDFFMLNVPIFTGEAAIRIAARLRYRKHGEGVKWFYDLYRVDQVFDTAFNYALDAVKVNTGLPLFIGTPAIKERSM